MFLFDGPSKEGQCAILQQQSAGELALSEVQSRLSRALILLQRDVGYWLLDDARPDCGGISLSQRPQEAPSAPKVSPQLPKEPVETDDEQRLVDRPGPCLNMGLRPHFPDDLMLVSRFVRLLGVRGDEVMCKTVVQSVRLMHLCRYDYADVVLVLAYASVYVRGIEAIGTMSELEAAHVCALLIYLAHCFLLDETCPLRCWQTHIFRQYCSLQVLESALFKLFQMQDFYLMVTADEERDALRGLLDTRALEPPASDCSGGTAEGTTEANATDGLSSDLDRD